MSLDIPDGLLYEICMSLDIPDDILYGMRMSLDATRRYIVWNLYESRYKQKIYCIGFV